MNTRAAALLLAAACHGGADTGGSAADPSITSGTVTCGTSAADGGSSVVFIVSIQATDPQGSDTVVSGTFTAAGSDGTALYQADLICDGHGGCATNFTGSDVGGADCTTAAGGTYTASVADADGHSSGETTLTFRLAR